MKFSAKAGSSKMLKCLLSLTFEINVRTDEDDIAALSVKLYQDATFVINQKSSETHKLGRIRVQQVNLGRCWVSLFYQWCKVNCCVICTLLTSPRGVIESIDELLSRFALAYLMWQSGRTWDIFLSAIILSVLSTTCNKRFRRNK
jgi:hypothetical protein